MSSANGSGGASLEVQGLTKRFGFNYAIRDLSFTAHQGEVVGFLGPNGAGKTTTMRIICGLITANAGRVRVGDQEVAERALEAKRRIGYMAESNPLPEEIRVDEYLRLRARLKGIAGREEKSRVGEVLEACDLKHKTQRKLIGTLSKGYRQRVGLADALLGRPLLTILDEPTVGLDPHQVLRIRELIARLRGTTTFLLSSHILSEVDLSCDRVVIINQGRLVAEGRREALSYEFIRQQEYRFAVRGPASTVVRTVREVDPAFNVRPDSAPDTDGFVCYRARTPRSMDVSEELLARLHAVRGLRLRAFERIEPTLEDIFLAATRRSLQSAARQAPADPGATPIPFEIGSSEEPAADKEEAPSQARRAP